MNNYDNSSTGINIECSVFYDLEGSQNEFTDNFERVGNSGHLFFFTGYGGSALDDIVVTFKNEHSALDDIVVTFKNEQVSNQKRQERKNFQMAVLWCLHNLPTWSDSRWYDDIKELFEISQEYYTPEDFLMAMIEEEEEAGTEGYYKAVKECELLDCNFQVAEIRGYCQGDFATIVYIDNGSWLEAESHFHNIFYDCEVYGHLTINGHEFYWQEYMTDGYTWDKYDFIKTFLDFEKEYIAKLEKETGNAGYIGEWLNDNLPEDLEYC